MARESGTGQNQDRHCAEVEHFLFSPFFGTTLFMLTLFLKFFHLFTAFVATLSQFVQNHFGLFSTLQTLELQWCVTPLLPLCLTLFRDSYHKLKYF